MVAARVTAVNAGCSPDKEVVRPGTIKEYGLLNVDAFKAFNTWLLEEEKPTYKGVVTKLAELRHHRWATWHVMCPDNPNVDDSCSMPCSPPAALTSHSVTFFWGNVDQELVFECFLMCSV